MKKHFSIVCILLSGFIFGQQSGINTTTPVASAAFEIKSVVGGFLGPRMTQLQRDAIVSPATGLMIYNTTTNYSETYNGINWYNSVLQDTNPATRPTSIINSINCETTGTGTIVVGNPVTGVTQNLTCNVAQAGPYNVTTTTSNGIRFSASGTFAGTGVQNIILTASGTPMAVGFYSFTLVNVAIACSFTRSVTDNISVVGGAGKIWMTYNLGANAPAASSTDYFQYGSLYQWGRGTDGHQLVNWTSSTSGTPVSGSTNVLSTTDQPSDALFITTPTTPFDWRSPQNNLLWQGVNGINNPCPAGYRLPTQVEFAQEITASGITNSTTAFASPLKLTLPGNRVYQNGTFSNVGTTGFYWTSTVNGTSIYLPYFGASSVTNALLNRAAGYSVRCLKD